jgi:hypothetical protein
VEKNCLNLTDLFMGFIFDARVGHITLPNVDARDDIKDVSNVQHSSLPALPSGFIEFAFVVLLQVKNMSCKAFCLKEVSQIWFNKCGLAWLGLA